MNFDLGGKEKRICENIRGLLAEPEAAELNKMGTLPPEALRGLIRRWIGLLKGIGYPTRSADDHGDTVSLTVIREQLAALSPPLFLSVEVSVGIFGRLVGRFGTVEQKEAVLPRLMDGGTIGAVALSEGGMTAVPADNGFSVTGSNGHVANAPVADWIAVAATVHGQEEPTFFLIEKDQEGLRVGERLMTLGYEGVPMAPVELADCPVAHVIHPPATAGILKTLRMWEDQILTAAGLGLMRRSFDAALKYAKTHESGGRPIMAHQEIGFKLAEMLTLFQTAQLLAYRAAWMCKAKDREAHVLTHSAKVFCGEAAEKIASHALQVLGREGFLSGNPVQAGYRDAKYIQIAGTSTEISRMKIGHWVLENL